MGAERMPARVAVEERREDLQRQRRRDEQRVALQRAEDHLAQLARRRRVLRQLHVVLRVRRLVAGRDAAIDPVGCVEHRRAWATCSAVRTSGT